MGIEEANDFSLACDGDGVGDFGVPAGAVDEDGSHYFYEIMECILEGGGRCCKYWREKWLPFDVHRVETRLISSYKFFCELNQQLHVGQRGYLATTLVLRWNQFLTIPLIFR